MRQAFLYESHSHTPLCKHAVGEPEEYAQRALERGLSGLVVTCHNPMPNGFSSFVRMAPEQFQTYVDMVARAREAYAGRVDVCLGLEADYFEGYESWVEDQLASQDFQYVLGSVHPQLPEYAERYFDETPLDIQRTYFRLLAQSAETQLFDCLAHPDLIKNMTPRAWDVGAIMDDMREALDRIAATGVAMEINTSGMFKAFPEFNPGRAMLIEMQQRNIPIVLGADAHTPDRVADGYEDALDLLAQCGFSCVHVFKQRTPIAIGIEQARACLIPADAISVS